MPKLTRQKFGKVLYDSTYWTIMHDGVEHAGYMAFLGLLSFFPFLVLFVALSGFIGQAGISAELVREISDFLPQHIIAVLEPRIMEIISGPPQGLLTVAIIGVCWTASSIVEGTRTILNRVYHVHTPPSYAFRRALSIVQMLVFTGMLIIVMMLLVLGPVFINKVTSRVGFDIAELIARWVFIKYVLSAAILFVIIAMSYYTLPNIRQRWISVVPGTLAVLVGWFGAAEIFSLYLSSFDQLSLVYGSLGGIIAALVFLYVISIIYIFGAEFNYHFEKAIGHKIVEKVHQRKRVKKKVKAKQRAKRLQQKKAPETTPQLPEQKN